MRMVISLEFIECVLANKKMLIVFECIFRPTQKNLKNIKHVVNLGFDIFCTLHFENCSQKYTRKPIQKRQNLLNFVQLLRVFWSSNIAFTIINLVLNSSYAFGSV